MTIAICPFLKPPTYDPANSDHQDWLVWWLDRMQVRISEMDDVATKMRGRSWMDLDRAVAEVKRRRPDQDDPEEYVSTPHKRIKRAVRDVFISMPRQPGRQTLKDKMAEIDAEKRSKLMAKKIQTGAAPKRQHEPTGQAPAKPAKDVAKQPPPWDNDDIPAPQDFWTDVGPER
jgi:hypothetical protein